MVLSFLQLGYLIKVKPFMEVADNVSEIGNEILVYLISMAFLTLSLCDDVSVQISIGWTIIYLTLAIFIFNWVAIVWLLAWTLWMKWKKRKMKS